MDNSIKETISCWSCPYKKVRSFLSMDTTPKQTLVVIIDDSPTICKILETCLQREGHQAVSYLNPVQALQALLRGEVARPDVLFVDLVLPQMDGY